MVKVQKVLLDTDIGTDVDDAIALAYLLANPNCDLLGITTVSGEAEKRAMLASALCTVAGKEIPIFPGIENPILSDQLQKKAEQAKALSKWSHKKVFPKGEAIEFLRRTIRANPGQIVLLAIGPLTNIGALLTIDPEIATLLKSIVIMGGKYNLTAPSYSNIEWNILGDYHAADIVYRSEVRIHRSVGIDITSRVTMDCTNFKKFCEHDLLKPVLDFSKIWFKEWDLITFHDPLAATTIFNNDICEFQKGFIDIETMNEKYLGLTYWYPLSKEEKHEVAIEVNCDNFFKEYLSVFQ